jgi:hypothetical protein
MPPGKARPKLWLSAFSAIFTRERTEHGDAMTIAEQRGMIRDLQDVVRKMTREEEETFAMFAKRNKDDEDLDLISRRKLQELYDRYLPKGNYHS